MEAMAQAPNDEQAVEVTEKAKRRQYSAAYKLKILQEADACTKPGEVGALAAIGEPHDGHVGALLEIRDAHSGQLINMPQRTSPR